MGDPAGAPKRFDNARTENPGTTADSLSTGGAAVAVVRLRVGTPPPLREEDGGTECTEIDGISSVTNCEAGDVFAASGSAIATLPDSASTGCFSTGAADGFAGGTTGAGAGAAVVGAGTYAGAGVGSRAGAGTVTDAVAAALGERGFTGEDFSSAMGLFVKREARRLIVPLDVDGVAASCAAAESSDSSDPVKDDFGERLC